MKKKMTQWQELALPAQSSAKSIVVACLCMLSLSVSMYVYFVGKIVFDVVGRRAAEASIQDSQSQISGLEVAYFDQMKNLTLASAQSLGLAESNDTLYASRQGAPDPKALGMADSTDL